jgi:hypothetical protein
MLCTYFIIPTCGRLLKMRGGNRNASHKGLYPIALHWKGSLYSSDMRETETKNHKMILRKNDSYCKLEERHLNRVIIAEGRVYL